MAAVPARISVLPSGKKSTLRRSRASAALWSMASTCAGSSPVPGTAAALLLVPKSIPTLFTFGIYTEPPLGLRLSRDDWRISKRSHVRLQLEHAADLLLERQGRQRTPRRQLRLQRLFQQFLLSVRHPALPRASSTCRTASFPPASVWRENASREWTVTAPDRSVE